MERYKKLGYPSNTARKYQNYWTGKIAKLMKSMHTESELRKCMYEIRNHFPNVSNSSAFLALVEAYGSVEEACAKLSDDQFVLETRLVGKVVDVSFYLADFIDDDDDDISLGSGGGGSRAVSRARSSRGMSKGGRSSSRGVERGGGLGDGGGLDGMSVISASTSLTTLPNIGMLGKFANIGKRVPTAEGEKRTRQSQFNYMSALANPQLKSNRKSPVDLMVEHFSPERQHSPAVSVKLGGVIRSTQWGVNERTGKMKMSRSRLVTGGGQGRGIGGNKLFSPVKALTWG